jgi:biopolymer transport protein ExbD
MNFTRHKRRRAPSVIIVSLIDVLLVVLIFLMVTTTFKKLEPALQLTLPKVDGVKTLATETHTFQILVDTNFPYYYFDRQPITLHQLQEQLVARVQQDPQLVVAIKADKSAPWGEVVRVIDIAKQAQPASIDIVTEKSRQ